MEFHDHSHLSFEFRVNWFGVPRPESHGSAIEKVLLTSGLLIANIIGGVTGQWCEMRLKTANFLKPPIRNQRIAAAALKSDELFVIEL
jgi:hypothetical protein